MTTVLTSKIIYDYIQYEKQPTNFKIVGCFRTQVLLAVTQVPAIESKKKCLWDTYEKIFLNIDWTDSFSTKLVILTNEDVSSESIIELHYWLRTKCANIKNIFLITSQNLGTKQWWKNWCDAMHEISFNVIDFAYDTKVENFLIQTNNINWLYKLEQIKTHASKWFSFYGGTYQKNERDYLCLMLAADFYNDAVIDYNGIFLDKDNLLSYTENISRYQDQDSINKLDRAYDCYVNDRSLIKNFSELVQEKKYVINETIDFSGLQWYLDRCCIFSIARETTMSDIYTGLSEKTLRSFLHWKMLIPVGYNSVNLLKGLGFWFPEDIFDYSYQFEKDWHQRVLKIKNSLHKIMREYCIRDMVQYIEDNKQNFLNNEELALKLYTTDRQCYLIS
jgi:hypothetical protein